MLLKMELKKIWKPWILLVIAGMGLLFGFLFLEFPLNYFPNGPQCEEQYRLMQEWAEKYGTEMDLAEYRDASEELKKMLGVTDGTADGDALISYAADSSEYLQQWASALYEYEKRYEILNQNINENVYTGAEQIRVEDVIRNEKRDGILPYEAMGNAFEYWRWVLVFLVFSVMVLLAPNVTKDALTGVYKLQYASKRGRNIIRTQFFAAVLSAFGIVILEIMIFAACYAKLGTWQFWNHPINSFYEGDVYWFDISFGQYLLFILLLAVFFSGSAAGIVFSLSCFSRNYISLILKMIPAFILLAFLSNQCVIYLFSFDNLIYKLTGIKGVEMIAAVLCCLIGAAFSLAAVNSKEEANYYRKSGKNAL